MSGWDIILYGALPYAAVAAFFMGHYWRYRRDQYGWTSRSTQLLESRALRLGSVAFHYGVFAAIGGHVLGILIPASWTDAVGIDEDAYHVISVIGGLTAGGAVLFGMLVLIWRRARYPRVRVTTTRNDVVVFALLAIGILTGLAVTVNNVVDAVNYRETASPWFRSLFALDPDIDAMSGANWVLQVHVMSVWLLYAMWPLSRLVHAWSIPVDWFRRSPVLFRGRSGRPRPAPAAAMRTARGRR